MEDGPYILDETEDYAVVFKPPRMHCASLKADDAGTLQNWYASIFPPVLDLAGRKAGEGGLVHRLDFETRGLVLFAKTQPALDFLLARQDEGVFVKEYHARCVKTAMTCRLPGFPPPPAMPGLPLQTPFAVESFFRPYGPGRRQVRPVIAGNNRRETAKDRGGYYRTEILNFSEEAGTPQPESAHLRAPAVSNVSGGYSSRSFIPPLGRLAFCNTYDSVGSNARRTNHFLSNDRFSVEKSDTPPNRRFDLCGGVVHSAVIRIRRGFRHQIRCHLAWLGCPILNDPLYGPPSRSGNSLALCAQALFFTDPGSGEPREYRAGPLGKH